MIRFKNIRTQRHVQFMGNTEDWLSVEKGHELWQDDSGTVWCKKQDQAIIIGQTNIVSATVFDEDIPLSPTEQAKKAKAKAKTEKPAEPTAA